MDRLHLMTIFVAVAEEGGLAKGARRLAMSAPAVSRAIVSLEQYLGCQLLTRTTRHIRLTEPGQRYLDDAKRILADIALAEETANGINAAPRGMLSVTAPVLFGKLHVIPILCDYLQRYPDMEASVNLVDRLVNLVEEGFDVGVRIGELPDSTMRAVRVGAVRRVVCAAPDYLRQHGRPLHPSELPDHTIVAAVSVSPIVEWKFDTPEGGSIGVRVRPRMTVSTNDSAIEAARRGLGITRVMSYQVTEQLRGGELECLLTDYETPPLPVHIVHREGIHATAKIRAFIDMAAAALRI
jgi:DNA-binding transcriptional LysR family regulator